MKRVIIESPFRENPERSLQYLRDIVRACVLKGEAAWGSHMIWPQCFNEADERSLGIESGYAWGDVADLHAFYTDLGWSEGMIEALDLCLMNEWPFELRALRLGITLPPPRLWSTDQKALIAESIRENCHGQNN